MLAHAAGWLAGSARLAGWLADYLSSRKRENGISRRGYSAAGLVKDVRPEGVFDPVKFPFSAVRVEDVGCEKRIARGKTHDR